MNALRPAPRDDRLGRRPGVASDWIASAPQRPEVERRPSAPTSPLEALERFLAILGRRAWDASAPRTRVVADVLRRLPEDLFAVLPALRTRAWLRRASEVCAQPFTRRQSRERATRLLLGANGFPLLVAGLRLRAEALARQQVIGGAVVPKAEEPDPASVRLILAQHENERVQRERQNVDAAVQRWADGKRTP